jgi:hypothetical protein
MPKRLIHLSRDTQPTTVSIVVTAGGGESQSPTVLPLAKWALGSS